MTETAANAIVEQADYYQAKQGGSLAQRWEENVDKAIRSLLRMPDRGSLCNFQHPSLRGLRRIGIAKFPMHRIFYEYDREKNILRVVHVIHGARDIESLLAEAER